MRRGNGEGVRWSSWRRRRRLGAIRRRRPHSPRSLSHHQPDHEGWDKPACGQPVEPQLATSGGNGGMGGTRGGMGISYSHLQGGCNVDAMAQQRRLGLLWSFLRQQDMMPRITEMGMAMPVPMPPADVGESIAAGNGSSDVSRIFSMSSSDDTNSNIMFSVPGSKEAEVHD